MKQKDIIECPNCSSIEIADVEIAFPYDTYIHNCLNCDFTIMESEWDSLEIRSLTIKEPYASLMLHGKIETRTWPSSYRGLVLIHAAAKAFNSSEVRKISGEYHGNRTIAEVSHEKAFSTGLAIGIGRLIHTRPMEAKDCFDCYVDYDKMLHCHIITDVRAIEPIPMKGGLGYRKINQKIKDQLVWKK